MNKKTKEEKIEETGGELTNIPNDKYKKFFEKFTEIDTLDVAQWKLAHVLGYFCKKYKQKYNLDYVWKFNNQNPNKCFEVWQANTLCAKLSSNPKILRDYIDWVFLTKVPLLKRRFTSISFITTDATAIEYKMGVLLAGKKNLDVNRSTTLPSEYITIFEKVGVSIRTYGDLVFISRMPNMADEIKSAFVQLESLNFDKSILERIV